MKIAIGGDHAGFLCKKEILEFIKEKNIEITDFGTNSESSVDYPDFAHPVASAVENKKADLGILVCGSGNGVAITANKHQGIRAALCWSDEIAKLARLHNNANVLCVPSRFIDLKEALAIVDTFLNTSFEGGRHEDRVNKISC